jgi:hypothetical protein
VDTPAADAIAGSTAGAWGRTDGVAAGAATSQPGLAVDIRGRAEPAEYVKLPFYHRAT